MRIRSLVSSVVALLTIAATTLAPHPALAAGSKLEIIASIPFLGGTDLDFSGNLAFVGSYNTSGDGGLWIIDIAEPSDPQVVGRYHCWGYQDDVAVRGSIVVMGMHNAQAGSGCKAGSGLRILDVSDPTTPRQTAFVNIGPDGTHTVTMVGDTGYVYSNPGGLSTSAAGQNTTIVDIRNPYAPKIAGTFRPPRSTGCHDININADATRAYCAASNATQIWDITDPVRPVVLSEIVNPAIFFHHGSVPSLDGETLVIADEALQGHACDGQGGSPTGALWFYDISDETLPILKGFVNPSRSVGVSALGWCTAHNFNMIPGKPWLAIASYNSGTQVVDFSDLSRPTTIGWVRGTNSTAWSSYYHQGHIYTGDTRRGFDVVSLDGLLNPA